VERSGTRRICWVWSSFHPTYELSVFHFGEGIVKAR
jgi:hypothetical protein